MKKYRNILFLFLLQFACSIGFCGGPGDFEQTSRCGRTSVPVLPKRGEGVQEVKAGALGGGVCSQESREFFFAAEVPMYLPFAGERGLQVLLVKEREFFRAKGKKVGDLGEKKYRLKDKKGKKWRGLFKPYTKIKCSPAAEGLSENAEEVRRLVKMFQEESFGKTAEEAQKMSAKHLRLVVLVNRMKSIFAVRNQSLKHSYGSMPQNTLILRGSWEPQWEVKKGVKYEDVSLKEVRQYMRFCLERYIKANSLEEKEIWLRQVTELAEEEGSIEGNHVPYHELREHLRISPEREVFIEDFMQTNPRGRLYEVTHDSDLLSLRVPNDSNPGAAPLGLYSLFMQKTGIVFPDVFTTGYRAAYDERYGEFGYDPEVYYSFMYQVIELDRYTRSELSRIHFMAAYVSEPNAFFLVPQGELCIPYSFLQLPNRGSISCTSINKYDPCESMAIMLQIFEANPRARVMFLPDSPVWMRLPDRMLVRKTAKTPHNVPKKGYDPSLDRFEAVPESIQHMEAAVSQTPFSTRDYAVHLYRSLGFCGRDYYIVEDGIGVKVVHPDWVFKSFACHLPKFFDPHQDKGSLVGKFKVGENPVLRERLVKIAAINAIDDGLGYLRKQAKQLKDLINEIFGPGVGDVIEKTARVMVQTRHDHYARFFSAKKLFLQRISPKQAMKLSPVEGKGSTRVFPTPCEDEDVLVDIKKELWPAAHAQIAEILEVDTQEMAAKRELQEEDLIGFVGKKEHIRILIYMSKNIDRSYTVDDILEFLKRGSREKRRVRDWMNEICSITVPGCDKKIIFNKTAGDRGKRNEYAFTLGALELIIV